MYEILKIIVKGDYPISADWGETVKSPNYPGGIFHTGIDIACPEGTEVFAGMLGKVLSVVYNDRDYGNYLKIANRERTGLLLYAHLKSVTVRSGDSVDKDTLIGYSGKTGNVTGAHLHIGAQQLNPNGEIVYNSRQGYVNPRSVGFFFDTTIKPTSSPSTPSSPTIEYPPYPPNVVNQTVSYKGLTFKGNPGEDWVVQETKKEIKENINAERPPYPPNVVNQTVSYKGNAFRGNPGEDWVFIGTDADRAKEQATIEAAERKAKAAQDATAKKAAKALAPSPTTPTSPKSSTTTKSKTTPGTAAQPVIQTKIVNLNPTIQTWPEWGKKTGPSLRDVYNLLVAIGNRIAYLVGPG